MGTRRNFSRGGKDGWGGGKAPTAKKVEQFFGETEAQKKLYY